MKLVSIGKMAALAGAAAFGLNAPAALAHKIVHVQGTLYVIVCDGNGGAFTFNGSASGAGDVAGILCPSASLSSSGGGAGMGGPIEAIPAGPALDKANAATAAHNCPAGTHWYEAGKACVANGGHPSPRSAE